MCEISLLAGVTEISSEMKLPERVILKSLSILKAHLILPNLQEQGENGEDTAVKRELT